MAALPRQLAKLVRLAAGRPAGAALVQTSIARGRWLLAAWALLLALTAVAASGAEWLRPEDAFRLKVSAEPGVLRLHWEIADGYYLYRSRIKVQLPDQQGVRFGTMHLPPAQTKVDPALGKVQVYHHGLELRIPYQRQGDAGKEVPVTISYQGCAERGLCYPPQTRTVRLRLPRGDSALPPVTDGRAVGSSEQVRLASLLASGNLGWVVVAFTGLGLLLAFTPCILPMIPILSSLIVGSGARTSPWRGLALSGAYVFSMAAAYSVLGVAAGRFGQNLQAWMQSPWIIGVFSGLFVVFALAMFGLFDIQLSGRLQTRLTTLVNRLPGGRLTSAAVMGFASALIVGPCVTPPLAGALLYIGQTGDMVTGGLALFALGFGMGTPLLLVGLLGGSILPRAGTWMEGVRTLFGFVLLAVAVWMLSRVVPPPVTVSLWGALLLAGGVFLGALEPLVRPVTTGGRLRKVLGVLAVVYGVVLLVGGIAGNRSVFAPLVVSGQRGVGPARQVHQQPAFRVVRSLDQLRVALAAARGRPVLVDFSADWCVSCKRMEEEVFADPRLATALQQGLLLRADVTANSRQERALMQELAVVGPPTLLFYGPDGHERRELRLVGETDLETVLARLRQLTGSG